MRLNNVRIETGRKVYQQQNQPIDYRQYRTDPMRVIKQESGRLRLEDCSFRADIQPDSDDEFPMRVALYIWNEPIVIYVNEGELSLVIDVHQYETPEGSDYCAAEGQLIFHAILGPTAGVCVLPLPYAHA